MRRSAALVLSFVLAASALAVSPASSVSLGGVSHPGTDSGNFYVSPDSFSEGQTVKLTANFPSSAQYLDVTFYEESPKGSGEYVEVGQDESNKYGNAYLSGYVAAESTTLFALTSKGEATKRYALEPEVVDPDACTQTGNLYTDPSEPAPGEEVKVTANFPSDQAGADVTFFQTVGDETVPIGSDDANRYGNAYLTGHQVDEEQDLHAVSTKGECTSSATVTPLVVDPDACSQAGNLYIDPSSVSLGDEVKVTANFANDQAGADVTFFKTVGEDTVSIGTDDANKYGNAYLSGHEIDEAQDLHALSTRGACTPVRSVVPDPKVTLKLQRDCTGNECVDTATATGTLEPAVEGRLFALEYLSGSTWKQIGAEVATDAEGAVELPLDLDGLSQWSARSYRIHSDGAAGSPSLASNSVSFMPGPTTLGSNVLRVDVEDGVFPTSKKYEYTGDAILSVDGTVTHDEKLSKFGVRGNSTARWVKKPFKLKFDDKPGKKDSTVFGMDRDKSWTLLASFKDLSLVRDKVGLDLGRRMDNIAWTPDSRFVEMFVNDQYRGSYLMTESVKIDGDRVDVDETSGMIMETDGDTVVDSSLGFMSKIGKIVFAFKDPDERKDGGADPTGVTEEKFAAIKDRINAFESKLYDSSTRTEYPDFIDVDSAIDAHLVQEFVKNGDGAFWRSHYFSWDPSDPNGTLRQPAAGRHIPLRTGVGLRRQRRERLHLQQQRRLHRVAARAGSCAAPAAAPRLAPIAPTGSCSCSRTRRSSLPSRLAGLRSRTSSRRCTWPRRPRTRPRSASARPMTGSRWPSSTRPRSSRGTYDDEVAFVTKWYKDRYTWMDGQLSN